MYAGFILHCAGQENLPEQDEKINFLKFPACLAL